MNLFILCRCPLIITGLSLSIAALVTFHEMISLYIHFAIHVFFLSVPPNALDNVIMMEAVDMHRYLIVYKFRLLATRSTSFFGYPLLGKSNILFLLYGKNT